MTRARKACYSLCMSRRQRIASDPRLDAIRKGTCPICRYEFSNGLTGLSSHFRWRHPWDEQPSAWRPDVTPPKARWKLFQDTFPDVWKSAKTKGALAKMPPVARHDPPPAIDSAPPAPPSQSKIPGAPDSSFEVECPKCHGHGKVRVKVVTP